tara:strand:- start:3982 stop:4545 length:564 start_codon:yes stop_codon:yes gene_type:complete
MNIFVLHENPIIAARMHCDKHVPKMCVEAAQMMASALRRHGTTDEQMPLTKAGTPYKGGYAHHPCTVWAGDNRQNFVWLAQHAEELCEEYRRRFGKIHSCHEPIIIMGNLILLIPKTTKFRSDRITPFALAMPDEYRPEPIDGEVVYHAYPEHAVKAYRRYYHSKQFAKWEKGTPAPDWWRGVEVKV